MSTPIEQLPPAGYNDFTNAPLSLSTHDPDNPPWGVGAGALVWLASVLLMFAMQMLFVVPYLLFSNKLADLPEMGQDITSQPNVILVSIIAIIPAHLLTIGIVWALVTRFGKRSFKRTIGWEWGGRFGLWTSAGLATLLLLVAWGITVLVGGGETQLDLIIASSPAARFATVFLATASAPFAEELVYRGVLFPAVQRQIGNRMGAVLIVATLFTVVHVAQYINNPGVIAAVAVLGFAVTYVRAVTGRLLPCIAIHMVFNGIQCFFLVLAYFVPLKLDDATKAGLLLQIAYVLNFTI